MSQFKVDWKEYTHTHANTQKPEAYAHTQHTWKCVWCFRVDFERISWATKDSSLSDWKWVGTVDDEYPDTHTHKRHFVWNNQSVVKALPSLENGDGSKRDNVWKTTHTSVGTFSSSSSQTWRSIAEHQKSKNIHSCFFFLSCVYRKRSVATSLCVALWL